MEDIKVIKPVRRLDQESPSTAEELSAQQTAPTPGAWRGAETVYTPDLGLMDLIQMAVVYAFIVAAALSAVFIFVGGISFILSGGNDDKIRQAINTIRYSIIGLVVVILSFTFVTIIGRMFGLNFLDYLKYSEIKNAINRLVQTGDQPVNAFEIQR
ncbi:MAG TPA: pilin [Candidatus Gracilibacteria bacterium]